MQGRGLRDQPAGEHPGQAAAAGDAQHSPLGQSYRHRDVRRRPGDLAFVFRSGRVLHHDLAGQVGGAQPQAQVVGIVPAAFPQASTRPDGGEQDGRRIGEVSAPG